MPESPTPPPLLASRYERTYLVLAGVFFASLRHMTKSATLASAAHVLAALLAVIVID